eukprot:13926-Heterococcus_DN1.PRE.3
MADAEPRTETCSRSTADTIYNRQVDTLLSTALVTSVVRCTLPELLQTETVLLHSNEVICDDYCAVKSGTSSEHQQQQQQQQLKREQSAQVGPRQFDAQSPTH